MEPSVYSLSLMMLMHNRNDSNQIVFKGLSLSFFFSFAPPPFFVWLTLSAIIVAVKKKKNRFRKKRQDCNRPITLSHAKFCKMVKNFEILCKSKISKTEREIERERERGGGQIQKLPRHF